MPSRMFPTATLAALAIIAASIIPAVADDRPTMPNPAASATTRAEIEEEFVNKFVEFEAKIEAERKAKTMTEEEIRHKKDEFLAKIKAEREAKIKAQRRLANPPNAKVQEAILGKLADAKARYAAAEGNDLLQASIIKEGSAALCEFAKTVTYATDWTGMLESVRRRDRFVRIMIRIGDGVYVEGSSFGPDVVIDAVAKMMPGTRVRFDGTLSPEISLPRMCDPKSTFDDPRPIELFILFDSIEAAQ